MRRGSWRRGLRPVALAIVVGAIGTTITVEALVNGAYAQRPEKEDEDRRKRGDKRQERSAPGAPSASPPAARGGRRDAETPKGDVGPQRSAPGRRDRTEPGQEPQQRTAPVPEQPSQQRRAAPQPDPRPEKKADPSSPSREDQQRGQGQARPSPREVPGKDESDRTRRDRPAQERSAPSEEKGPQQQQVAPQPDPRRTPGFGKAVPPQPRRDDSRSDQVRPVPRALPGQGPDRDRDRDRAGERDRDRDRAGDRDRDRDRDGDRDRDRGRADDRDRDGDRAGDRGRGVDRARRDEPRRLEDVKKRRVERVEAGGRRVIEEPGNRFIIREQGRAIIRRDESRALERLSPNARTRDIGEGRRRTEIERSDGTRVVSEVDRNGRLLRRYRRDRSGREIVLIDNRRFYRNVGLGLGVTALGVGVSLALAPPAYSLPREKYIVEYDNASEDDLYEALSAPPVAELERPYSLEEIRYSRPLREYMRRIDLDTINFEFGSFEVAPDQYPKLERLARIIERVLRRNEAEVFLIEGHTDAVGSDEDNLTLSDRRAEAVAEILMSEFGVPIENLVTQGYGEQHLKVETEAPEQQNRRVALRRITPLLGLNSQ
jgi:outer membrane protein OmpA-like peptidoglycan-associated protein